MNSIIEGFAGKIKRSASDGLMGVSQKLRDLVPLELFQVGVPPAPTARQRSTKGAGAPGSAP